MALSGRLPWDVGACGVDGEQSHAPAARLHRRLPRGAHALSKTGFFLAVEADLRLLHVPFDKAEPAAFLRGVWPLVEPGDLPAKWAEAFLAEAAAAG
jgi:hypothetical protein